MNNIKKMHSEFTDCYVFNTEKFNTILLFFTLELPLSKFTEEDIPYVHLLPYILRKKLYDSKNLTKCSYVRDIVVNTEKKGENFFIYFEIEVPSEKLISQKNILKGGIDLLFNLIFQPIFENNKIQEVEIEYSKIELKKQIDIYSSDTFISSNIRILEEMYPNDLYIKSIYKYKNLLTENICIAHINKIYEYIISISEKNLYLIGSIDTKQIDIAIDENKNYKIYANNHLNKTIEKINNLNNRKTKYVLEEDEINQGKLLVGIKTLTSNDYKSLVTLKLANGILGKFPTSLLFSALREREHLCYFVNSQINFDKNHIIITVSTNYSNYVDLLNKIENEITKLKSQGISDKLFNQTKLQFINLYKEGLDNPKGILNKVIDYKNFKLESLEEEMEIINSITIDDIIENTTTWSIDTIYQLNNGGHI
ncbi:insulinase family protein [Mammaliicoccus sciuri]|uniref:insulinase family protein n=1 Tax=Mammaliicoccus sciuri TaxID=1296 RepID=UPI003A931E89